MFSHVKCSRFSLILKPRAPGTPLRHVRVNQPIDYQISSSVTVGLARLAQPVGVHSKKYFDTSIRYMTEVTSLITVNNCISEVVVSGSSPIPTHKAPWVCVCRQRRRIRSFDIFHMVPTLYHNTERNCTDMDNQLFFLLRQFEADLQWGHKFGHNFQSRNRLPKLGHLFRSHNCPEMRKAWLRVNKQRSYIQYPFRQHSLSQIYILSTSLVLRFSNMLVTCTHYQRTYCLLPSGLNLRVRVTVELGSGS